MTGLLVYYSMLWVCILLHAGLGECQEVIVQGLESFEVRLSQKLEGHSNCRIWNIQFPLLYCFNFLLVLSISLLICDNVLALAHFTIEWNNQIMELFCLEKNNESFPLTGTHLHIGSPRGRSYRHTILNQATSSMVQSSIPILAFYWWWSSIKCSTFGWIRSWWEVCTGGDAS